ncbi:MAG TPA: 23S rRNA (uracil(1939)-C(5))-methyltransferase RlmD [Chloroflexota bacterium]|nr:23S rRNA (uracil(1939)-C(5))-methyltransferase RlmD [Chloroflexota bacterium]
MEDKQPAQVTLHGVAHGGEAVGRLDDLVTFAGFGLPGERVALEVLERKPRYLKGRVVEVLQASPDRVTAPCPIFGTCGGCHWQHASYEAQLRLKTEVLHDQLLRLGKLEAVPIEPAVPSPREWHYRNTVQLVPVPGVHRLLGFQRSHSHEPVAVEHCYISDELINRVIHDAPWGSLSDASWERLSAVELRVVPEAAAQVTLIGRHPLTQTESRRFVRAARAALPELAGVLEAPGRDRDPAPLWGSTSLTYHLADCPLEVPAGAFMQVNVGAAERLVALLLEWLQPSPTDTLVDLYAGVGTFSVPLSKMVQTVTAVEAHPLAAGALVRNAALNEQTNVLVHTEAVEQALPRLGGRTDLVILDPPRRGCTPAALAGVARLEPRRIAYVSCEPSTLARDLRLLGEAGYRPLRVCAVDLFPQTYHLESVTLLERPLTP